VVSDFYKDLMKVYTKSTQVAMRDPNAASLSSLSDDGISRKKKFLSRKKVGVVEFQKEIITFQ